MSRAARLTTTRSGLQIGVAYVAPPPQPGTNAERIQHLLLARPRAPGASDYLAAALALLVLRLHAALQDSDLLAVYRQTRNQGASRWKAIRRALHCCPLF